MGLQGLHLAELNSTLEAASAGAETEDQRAMRKLQRVSEEFMPALAAIRDCAVDRTALARLEEAVKTPSLKTAGPEATSVGSPRKPVESQPTVPVSAALAAASPLRSSDAASEKLRQGRPRPWQRKRCRRRRRLPKSPARVILCMRSVV